MDWDDLKPKPPKGITLGESLESLSVERARGAHRRAAPGDRAGAGRAGGQEGARGGGCRHLQAVSAGSDPWTRRPRIRRAEGLTPCSQATSCRRRRSRPRRAHLRSCRQPERHGGRAAVAARGRLFARGRGGRIGQMRAVPCPLRRTARPADRGDQRQRAELRRRGGRQARSGDAFGAEQVAEGAYGEAEHVWLGEYGSAETALARAAAALSGIPAMLAGRSRLRPAGPDPHAGTGVSRPMTPRGQDVDETCEIRTTAVRRDIALPFVIQSSSQYGSSSHLDRVAPVHSV